LFDESDFMVKHHASFTNTEWEKFLSGYGKIFREIDKKIFEWYFKKENYFTILKNIDSSFIGIYGLLRVSLNFDSNSIDSFLCHNVGILNEYSGQGLFQFIAEKALSNYCNDDNLVLGFPNRASYKGHIRVGWEPIANVRFLQFDDLAQNMYLSDNYKFIKIDKFDKELDKVVNRFNSNFSLSLVKNSEFLNWRVSKPHNRYLAFLLKKDGEIGGYFILKKHEEGREKRLHLVDYNFIDIEALEEIIKFSIKFYQNGNYKFLNGWAVENSIFEEVFLKNDFRCQNEFPSYPIILFQKNNHFKFDEIDKKKVFFTLFDNDVF
jgi:hypothetical protein